MSELPLGGFLEQHGLVGVSPRRVPDAPASVAALVDYASDTFGGALALTDRRQRFSFVELREAVDRAADVLSSLGVQQRDRVVVSLPNTTDTVIAFLATMRLGAMWVGINTNLATPEKRFLLDDSGARVVVGTPEIASALASDGLSAVPVDVDGRGSWWRRGAAIRRPDDGIDPDGPAAIAYTSGTTGRPKGVVHSQHNMMLPAAAITRSDPGQLAQGAILPLAILNMQILSTVQSLLCGGSLVPIGRIDAPSVARAVAEFGVQRMYVAPPTVYDLLTRPDIDPDAIASLSHLVVGGSKCPEGLRERYRERFGRDSVFGYGLTEAPTGVTGPAPQNGAAPVGSSGVAREHVEVSVRNDDTVLGPGGEGEICVGPTATGVFAGCYSPMLGYWNHPERTRRAVREGVLHTGDVGRIDEDGVLWVLDRRSDLIIRGGANVYPAEVERVVEALPQISEVAVIPRPHARLGEEVVAVVRTAAGIDAAELHLDELIDSCRAQLAAYKVPVAWYSIEQFPRNAMGKVVKSRLRRWLDDGAWEEDLPAPVEVSR